MFMSSTFIISQAVTLLFLLRFSPWKTLSANQPIATSSRTTSHALFESLLFITINVASVLVLMCDFLHKSLKIAILIETTIVYLMYAIDNSKKTTIDREDMTWNCKLRNLNDDLLKIVIIYNIILINKLEPTTAIKLIDIAMKVFCLFLMLRYEFRNEQVIELSEKEFIV
ncbi:hypothetical protein CANMA_000825 [Candida margitis]|uniref:uncharacterized protein n=1 Tax=Candida margitis TaxID=1775924 RepID=UPI002227FD6E|nr:uncharacterized protein CANMA_000825 [Candida margitis]KAI5970213.1 hypothetical protein CANMA_000825 [Candida margitis]